MKVLDILANIPTEAVAPKQCARIAIVQEGVAPIRVQLPQHRDPPWAQHTPQLPKRSLQVWHIGQNRYTENRGKLLVGVGELADILLGDLDLASHNCSVGR